MGQDEPAEMTA